MELQKQLKDNNTGQIYWEAMFKVIIPRPLNNNEYAFIEQNVVKLLNEILNPKLEVTPEQENHKEKIIIKN